MVNIVMCLCDVFWSLKGFLYRLFVPISQKNRENKVNYFNTIQMTAVLKFYILLMTRVLCNTSKCLFSLSICLLVHGLAGSDGTGVGFSCITTWVKVYLCLNRPAVRPTIV